MERQLENIDLPLGTILHQYEGPHHNKDRFGTRYIYLGPTTICQLHFSDYPELSLEKEGEHVVLQDRETLKVLAEQILDWLAVFPDAPTEQ